MTKLNITASKKTSIVYHLPSVCVFAVRNRNAIRATPKRSNLPDHRQTLQQRPMTHIDKKPNQSVNNLAISPTTAPKSRESAFSRHHEPTTRSESPLHNANPLDPSETATRYTEVLQERRARTG
jgi:hypothetical protein